MQGLGYASFGPFPLGDDHQSDAVDAEYPQLEVRWLETAHFRLGSTLAERPIPEDSGARKALYGECRRLHRRLASVPAEPPRLDPWLQVHLLAQRLEDTYADFAGRTGVDEQWFGKHATERGRGDGPFLGCRSKQVVLVFQQQAELARYLRRFCDRRVDGPWSQRWERLDTMLFATAAECCQGRLQEAHWLHAHVVHGVVLNLIDGFVASDVTMPFWWREGVAHWYLRRIDPRLADLTDFDLGAEIDPEQWPARVLARVRRDLLPPTSDLLHWWDGRQRSEADHALLWSLADFLMQQGDPGFARFLLEVRERPMRSRYMPQSLVLEWHEQALRVAYGAGVEVLFSRWRKYVTKAYR
jgi:hypothetical protein